jgi:hypothetical protein
VAGPTATGTRTWLDPTWQAEALGWAEQVLSGLDRRVDGPIEQPHVRPWSTAFRIPTDRGTAWLKACGPGPAYEGPLLDVFSARGVRRVPLPLAVHPDRPWLLLDDAGPTLRQMRPDGTGDHDLGAWERILAEYAELQRSLESDDAVAAMLAAGTPDGRPAALPGELARLLDDDAWWERLTSEERDEGAVARRTLRAQLTVVTGLADEVAAAGIAASVQHDDLHGGNVLVGPDGDRFFDWGDAVVAHPFGTLTVTFNSIAHKLELPPYDSVFTRLEAVYLAVWNGVAPPADLERVARIARVLGCIGRALAWERSLIGLKDDEMDGFGDGVAGWLVEFASRLGRFTATR